MSSPEAIPDREVIAFEAPPFDASDDLCGDLVNARLRGLFAGNQYMALPDLVAGFLAASPEDGPVFYETLPPGILVEQLRRGGLRLGRLLPHFTPDVIAASPRSLEALRREGLVGEAKVYAWNRLTLLVAHGNPAGIRGIEDLGRAGIRVALPDPSTEGIGRLALDVLRTIGGQALEHEVTVRKRGRGETLLTSIHHRQTPAWILDGRIDMGVVWETEALHHARLGSALEAVEIEEAATQRGEYAVAAVSRAPRHQAAERFVAYLVGEAGRRVYEHYGFATTKQPSA